MFRAIVYAAVLSGIISGIFVSAVQAVRVVPLILEAEKYEAAASADVGSGNERDVGAGLESGDEDKVWAPDGVFERIAFTVSANLLAAIGYALLLAAAFAATGSGDWHSGLLWGLGGFAAFALAPALGLPPELPGAAAAELGARQAWWGGTAAATAAGLALVVRSRHPHSAVLGILLIALPHLIGAPEPQNHEGVAPEALARAFVVASLITNFLFWAVLGAATGFFFDRLGHDQTTTS